MKPSISPVKLPRPRQQTYKTIVKRVGCVDYLRCGREHSPEDIEALLGEITCLCFWIHVRFYRMTISLISLPSWTAVRLSDFEMGVRGVSGGFEKLERKTLDRGQEFLSFFGGGRWRGQVCGEACARLG
ncbi:hypothetical protein CLIM01_12843 [Colletotrichum limetticola]|uniref:Uncharacterized protein n=1 Tax=Colletotrichum limetticola TaxID=1209924 RepID=A0ABQ9PCK3_9PEZI|nr:hypothetical protein CLIM01_12843 [Colletotrichum limetticola]